MKLLNPFAGADTERANMLCQVLHTLPVLLRDSAKQRPDARRDGVPAVNALAPAGQVDNTGKHRAASKHRGALDHEVSRCRLLASDDQRNQHADCGNHCEQMYSVDKRLFLKALVVRLVSGKAILVERYSFAGLLVCDTSTPRCSMTFFGARKQIIRP